MLDLNPGALTADTKQEQGWVDFDRWRSEPLKITPRAELSLVQPRRVGTIPPSREWLGNPLFRLSRDEAGQLYLQGELVDVTFENRVVRIHTAEGKSYVVSDVVYTQLFYTTHATPAVDRLMAALHTGATRTCNRESYDFWLVERKQRSRVHPSTIGRALGLRLIAWTGSWFELAERTQDGDQYHRDDRRSHVRTGIRWRVAH